MGEEELPPPDPNFITLPDQPRPPDSPADPLGPLLPVDYEQKPAQSPPAMTGSAGDKGKDQGGDEASPKEPRKPWYSIHSQGTVVTQDSGLFRSPYVGPNSFLPDSLARTTETATLFLDVRPWECGEIIFNPEISGGFGLSGTVGVAGFPNGEATRVGDPAPTPYIARLLYRHTIGLEGEQEKVEDDANQIAGVRPVDRLTVSVGKMAATDLADNNPYSHDPRTQFLNWSIMYDAAWDYPSNVRGYTYGLALDLNTTFWALRYGIFAEPKVANGAALDPKFLRANGQIIELEERWGLHDYPGSIREWFYLNQAHMGSYRLALAEMPVNPDITQTRAYRIKYGFGVNVDQSLTHNLGAFAKAGWNNGQTESWAFTEIDASGSVGLLLKGKQWRRPQDQVGLATVVNALSPEHRDYLAAGGLGFIIGDGRLNYGLEEILETYYNWEIHKGINLTADFQEVNHPAYNRDRGPISIVGVRVHLEY